MLRTHYPSEPLYELGVHLYGFEQVFTRGSAVLSNRGCELLAQRVLGGNHDLTLMMQLNIARALYKNSAATLDDLREAVTTLEETTRIARRVFGGAYPLTMGIERELRDARAALAAREDTKIK